MDAAFFIFATSFVFSKPFVKISENPARKLQLVSKKEGFIWLGFV
jgi:hypothetical protein